MTKEDFEVKIKWSLLQRIAEYYQFPAAVFLGKVDMMPEEKTRNESVIKRNKEFAEKVRGLVEEYYGE